MTEPDTLVAEFRTVWSYPYGVAACGREEAHLRYRGVPFRVSRYRTPTGRISHYASSYAGLSYGYGDNHGRGDMFAPTLAKIISQTKAAIDRDTPTPAALAAQPEQ